MIARKLRKLRKPEYGSLVPRATTPRSTTLKRRIAITTRSIGEVLRNHTKKRRRGNGGKFRDPEVQYILARGSWWPEMQMQRLPPVSRFVFSKSRLSQTRERSGHSSEPGCDGGCTQNRPPGR